MTEKFNKLDQNTYWRLKVPRLFTAAKFSIFPITNAVVPLVLRQCKINTFDYHNNIQSHHSGNGNSRSIIRSTFDSDNEKQFLVVELHAFSGSLRRTKLLFLLLFYDRFC